jgi:hypothetical protein
MLPFLERRDTVAKALSKDLHCLKEKHIAGRSLVHIMIMAQLCGDCAAFEEAQQRVREISYQNPGYHQRAQDFVDELRSKASKTPLVEWCTETAVSLARQMCESRDFTLMPILADALEDAGCDNENILAHCRGSGPHVRGCWVIELLLRRE